MSRFDRPAAPPSTAAVLAAAPGLGTTPAITRGEAPRVGVICNPRSHGNRQAEIAQVAPAGDVTLAAPRTHGELAATLTEFAAAGIELLVIDGGDGTVRDVLTAAAAAFGDTLPQVALLPTGKTNALALDLGVPDGWTLDQALAAARTGALRRRAPLVVERRGSAALPLHGFLFGAGGFVRATELAQRTHRVGAFHGLAVALALVWALLQTFFGRASGVWRRGEPMRVRGENGQLLADGDTFVFLASTLERFPVGLKPFGPTRPGLKTLTGDAPARLALVAAVAIVAGKVGGWLIPLGYRHRDVAAAAIELSGGFILDGDFYDDARVRLVEGAPIAFVVP